MATASNVHKLNESAAYPQENAQGSERPELPEYLRPRVAADQPGRGVRLRRHSPKIVTAGRFPRPASPIDTASTRNTR
jgi:hypothetical protein